MTTIVGNQSGNSDVPGIDMQSWHLNEIGHGTITAHNGHSVTIEANDHIYVVSGHHFTYDIFGGDVSIASGRIDGITVYPNDASTINPPADFTISDFSMSVRRFNGYTDGDHNHAFKHALMRGDDLLKGGASQDALQARGGFDCLYGGDGDDALLAGKTSDLLQGDAGADYLAGGRAEDLFVFNSAADSGNGMYDTMWRFHIHQDHVVVPNTITGVDHKVDAGIATTQTIEDVLTTALDADHMGADHAVVARVQLDNASKPATFLVVDLNGVAGYQTGEDLVVRIAAHSPHHHMSADDFMHTF